MIGDGERITPSDPVSIGFALADALNRERSLTQWESGLVAALAAKALHPQPLRRWTSTQDEQLRDLLSRGHTAAEIGAQIGRSTDAIHTRVKRLKLKESAIELRR
ncbi:GcrA family cell cycle regulator [Sphingomonas sp. TZW2008]|uniref:GcrA family cell cycle regulator n=1 Tax=Sphingomonas sp. TZW2008 TaxID=1917973 RepID=UPI000A26CBAD|nr:GcrA family cell cycle regulator [Sphingomonas sp. TZW2008]